MLIQLYDIGYDILRIFKPMLEWWNY